MYRGPRRLALSGRYAVPRRSFLSLRLGMPGFCLRSVRRASQRYSSWPWFSTVSSGLSDSIRPSSSSSGLAMMICASDARCANCSPMPSRISLRRLRKGGSGNSQASLSSVQVIWRERKAPLSASNVRASTSRPSSNSSRSLIRKCHAQDDSSLTIL